MAAVSRGPPKPPPLKPGAKPIDIMAVAMDPLEAGRQVLAGIRRNDLYILSHPEFEPVVRQRVTLMLASFSKKPVPPGPAPRHGDHHAGHLRRGAGEAGFAEAADQQTRGRKKAVAKKKPGRPSSKRTGRGRR